MPGGLAPFFAASPAQSAAPSIAPSAALRLVAIGASAGGVEALGVLLRALPARCPAAVVVVLHLAPGRSSRLPQLYAQQCLLPLSEAQDKEPLLPGRVYFAPPDYHLQIEPDFSFSLSLEAPVFFSRPAIDVLLETAALACRSSMLAIILTGASADGARGLARVRQLGGGAWIQDPATAVSGVMPAAALRHAGADQVLELGELAACLARLVDAA